MQTKMRHFTWLIALFLLALGGCAVTDVAPEPQAGADTAVIDTPADDGVNIAVDRPATDDAAVSGLAQSNAPVTVEREALSSYIGGFGGGGYSFDFIERADFNITVGFPSEPRSAPVWQLAPMADSLTLDQVKALGQRLGFTGPVYLESYPGATPEALSMPGEPGQPFVMFDVNRRLTVSGSYVTVEDRAAARGAFGRISRADAMAAAERYAQSTGWLDFAYEMHSGFGNEVQFRPVVDGYPLDYIVLNVTVNDAGEVAWVNYQPLPARVQTTDYALRGAADTWDALQSGDENGFYFNIFPTDEQRRRMTGEQPQAIGHWQRSAQATGSAGVYGWPQVYRSAESGDLRIVVEDLVLQADAATLADIAATGQSVFLEGTIATGADGFRTLTVSDWSAFAQPGDISLSGNVWRDGGNTYLRVNGGQSLLLPDAPADLADEARVYAYAWGLRDVGTGIPVLEWVSLDQADYAAVPHAEPAMPLADPYSFTAVTIEKIDLVQHFTYSGDPMLPAALRDNRAAVEGPFVMPMWRYTGVTDSGATIELFVNAIPNG